MLLIDPQLFSGEFHELPIHETKLFFSTTTTTTTTIDKVAPTFTSVPKIHAQECQCGLQGSNLQIVGGNESIVSSAPVLTK